MYAVGKEGGQQRRGQDQWQQEILILFMLGANLEDEHDEEEGHERVAVNVEGVAKFHLFVGTVKCVDPHVAFCDPPIGLA